MVEDGGHRYPFRQVDEDLADLLQTLSIELWRLSEVHLDPGYCIVKGLCHRMFICGDIVFCRKIGRRYYVRGTSSDY